MSTQSSAYLLSSKEMHIHKVNRRPIVLCPVYCISYIAQKVSLFCSLSYHFRMYIYTLFVIFVSMTCKLLIVQKKKIIIKHPATSYTENKAKHHINGDKEVWKTNRFISQNPFNDNQTVIFFLCDHLMMWFIFEILALNYRSIDLIYPF